MNYPIDKIRSQFPILETTMNGKPLVYFDNGATTQKPQIVIDAIVDAYTSCYANVHRGVYKMSREATERHENARRTVAKYINALPEETLFTAGGTESLNAIAYSFGEALINKGDNIVVTIMDHHSNFVPWQQLALRKGAKFTVVTLTPNGDLDREAFTKAISIPHTKIVAFPHVSNVLGTVNPVKELISEVHNKGAFAVIDGAQAVAHTRVDVKDIDADFYTFSSHKMYGPTGIGVLYGKTELLQAMPPFLYGGEMIQNVKVTGTTFADIPYKFEAGTPNFVGSVALATAVDYINSIGIDSIHQHEQELLGYALEKLRTTEGITLIGTPQAKDPVISFLPNKAHPYDLGLFLDEQGFALRSGHHCAEPLMESLGVTSTLRASFAMYNTKQEIDAFITALNRSLALLQ